MSGAPPSARKISRRRADTFCEMSVQTLIVSRSPAHVAQAALGTSGVGVCAGRPLLLLPLLSHTLVSASTACLFTRASPSSLEQLTRAGSAASSKHVFFNLWFAAELFAMRFLSASPVGPATSVLCPFSLFRLLISVP